MSPENRTIRRDADCACGYNLRGLTLGHLCPECGRPVSDSVAQGIRSESPRTWEEVETSLRQRAVQDAVSTRNKMSSGAVWWVTRALSYANFRGGPNVGARALCSALRDYARVEMKTECAAVNALARAGIRSSEDLGRVVLAMLESGALQSSKNDSIRDFDGLFTLENLFQVQL